MRKAHEIGFIFLLGEQFLFGLWFLGVQLIIVSMFQFGSLMAYKFLLGLFACSHYNYSVSR